jgi:hypothetical protein
MKKLLLITVCYSFFCVPFISAQTWLWGRQGKVVGIKPQVTGIVATDDNGNAFLTGGYFPSISFNSDTLEDSTIISHSSYGTYFIKYNSAGTIQWAEQFTTSGSCFPVATATDASNNVIITGGFNPDITIGSFYLTGQEDFFLTKCDNNGNPLWAIEGGGHASTTSVATDNLKNIFVTGTFYGTLHFGNLNILNTPPTFNIFNGKCDSTGNALWAEQGNLLFHNVSCYAGSNAVTTDMNGNSIITGWYNDSIVFGTDTLTSPVLSNNWGGSIFIVKYDPNGNVLWAKQSVLPSASSAAQVNTITSDNAGNIYVTGTYLDTISFGAYTIQGEGLFFLKYNSSGNIVWLKRTGDNFTLPAYSLSSDEFNNIYMVGGLEDSITFGTFTLGGGNDYSSYLIKFDSSGTVICGSKLQNGSDFSPVSLAVDRTGTFVYQASIFFNDTVFSGSDTLIAYGQDPYVARWENCWHQETDINSVKPSSPSVDLYPNPNNGVFTIQSSVVSRQWSVEIYNILGEKVFTESVSGVEGKYIFDLSSQPSGIYLYRIIDENKELIKDGKFVIE